MMLNRRGSGSRSGNGNGGNCVCVSCGTEVSHRSGVPCTDMTCPSCGKLMIRDALVNTETTTRSSKRVAVIVEAECVGCGRCINSCPFDAIHMVNDKAIVDFDNCKGCMKCINSCPTGAIVRG